MFELQYEPLIIRESLPHWKIALVPWDTETFGFGVSVLNPCCFEEEYQEQGTLLNKQLESYARRNKVKLITATIPADQEKLGFLLQKAGFCFVDLSLDVQYDLLPELPNESRDGFTLIPADPQDMELLAETAGRSFRHGRYHQDPRIPAELANRRYSDWVRRCLHPDNPQQTLKAVFQGEMCGFSIVEYKEKSGYMHLHAIDSKWRGQKLGKAMITESIRYLHRLGADQVRTRISATNLKTLNMHSGLKARFVSSDRLYHWFTAI